MELSESKKNQIELSEKKKNRIELSEKKKLTYEKLEDLLKEKKGNQSERITFNKQKIEEVLPFDLAKRDIRYIEAYIIEAIKEYKKKNV